MYRSSSERAQLLPYRAKIAHVSVLDERGPEYASDHPALVVAQLEVTAAPPSPNVRVGDGRRHLHVAPLAVRWVVAQWARVPTVRLRGLLHRNVHRGKLPQAVLLRNHAGLVSTSFARRHIGAVCGGGQFSLDLSVML